MSSVTFNSPAQDVSIGGAERAYADSICRRINEGILDLTSFSSADRIREMFPPGVRRDVDSIRNMMSGFSFSGGLSWNGHKVDVFGLALNTALALGNDVVKFCARLHGSCEIHGFVLGKNRAWLADIIDEGSASGLLRKPYQTQYDDWSVLSTMLRSTAETPVVMSYSVCDDFPNQVIALGGDLDFKNYAKWTDEQKEEWAKVGEEYYEWTDEKKWQRAFAALQALEVDGYDVQLKPESWNTFRFSHKLSALDLVAPDWKARFDAAFPKEKSGDTED